MNFFSKRVIIKSRSLDSKCMVVITALGVIIAAAFTVHVAKGTESLEGLGQEVALYVKKHLVSELIKLYRFKAKQCDKALIKVFYKMDEMMLTPTGKKEITKLNNGNDQSYAGCTATTVIITPTEIFCANAGDSRTVISENNQAFGMSVDHTPDDPEERKRIYNANGFVKDSCVNGDGLVCTGVTPGPEV